MAITAAAICPHCGHIQPIWIDHIEGKKMVKCNSADGGCNCWYAVFYWMTVQSQKVSDAFTQEVSE
jgi:hypothetical protein